MAGQIAPHFQVRDSGLLKYGACFDEAMTSIKVSGMELAVQKDGSQSLFSGYFHDGIQQGTADTLVPVLLEHGQPSNLAGGQKTRGADRVPERVDRQDESTFLVQVIPFLFQWNPLFFHENPLAYHHNR